MKCKFTKQPIKKLFSYGSMPIANGFINKDQIDKEFFYDLSVGFSEDISLFQINDHPSVESMFNDKYPFFTSKSAYMVNHFENFADSLYTKKLLDNSSNVLEIGSNDGTFLSKINKYTKSVLGVEPSTNVYNIAVKKGINSINSFFSLETSNGILSKNNQFDLVVAANVICHIPDIKDLFLGIKNILKENGSFVFEEPYLLDMFKKTSYDQIYDEHIYIFSLSAIENICKEIGLNLYHAEKQETHGGSMRYFISKNINKTSEVLALIEEEKLFQLDKIETAIRFCENCEISKKILNAKINSILDKNKRICGYGATSKSTTILNYCKINNDQIEYIVDNTPEKQNLLTPGTHIPIYDISKFKEDTIEYVFLFAWNHEKEITNKEQNFIKRGGKFFNHLF